MQVKEMKGKEVELAQMLNAREQRAFLQMRLLNTYQKPLLCFTMNIAGPIKNNALIHEGFQEGLRRFKAQLMRMHTEILQEVIVEENTGNEAFLVLDSTPQIMKEIACFLEDQNDLGRLYDMDVLYLKDDIPTKMDREELGKPGRTCLLCGKPAKECSSRRVHTVKALQERTMQILDGAMLEKGKQRTAEHAVRALLYEVTVTPKPGLVDRANSGSHKDMNFYTFLNSAASLHPYFANCYEAGWMGRERTAVETFTVIRKHGLNAEGEMLRASGGVNTHKGAIFSLGILSAAIGRRDAMRFDREEMHAPNDVQEILKKCAELCEGIVANDMQRISGKKVLTVGERLYVEHGITGVRGMAEAGFPIVSEVGYPLLKQLLEEGRSFDEAGGNVLLTILSQTVDTNMICRSDLSTLTEIREELSERLKEGRPLTEEEIKKMDRAFIERNLSPGGSADLLAMCFMLYFTEKGE